MCAEDRQVSATLLGVSRRPVENLSQPQSDPARVLVGKVLEYRLKRGVGLHFDVEGLRETQEGWRTSRILVDCWLRGVLRHFLPPKRYCLPVPLATFSATDLRVSLFDERTELGESLEPPVRHLSILDINHWLS
jgi:hypothetical protein